MKKNELLVLTPSYPFEYHYGGIFIKEQLNSFNDYFSDINVISHLSYFPKKFINFDFFKKYSTYRSYPTDYVEENISIFFPRHFPLPKSNNYIFFKIRCYLSFLSVQKLIKDKNISFDLIHSHFLYPSGYMGMKLKEKYDVPLILTVHGGDIYDQPFQSQKKFFFAKHVLEEADHIITTSKRNYNIITKEMGIKTNKVNIIGNGFNEKLFYPMSKYEVRKELKIEPDIKIILSIGNTVKIKGHKYLIEAIYKMITINKKLICLIIGNGDKTELNKLIKKLNLENHVKILDGQPHNELPIWINACDIFALPSLDEGFPTIVSEVLGCGKPVVATNVGNLPNIITKDLGILVKVKDSDDLASGITEALTKEWDNNKISEEAKKHYTWTAISKQILKVYSYFI